MEDVFTVISGNVSHTFSGPSFAAVSKKCRRLRSHGINSFPTRHPLIEEFISACQLQPFDVDLSNVHDLYALSDEWQVDSLSAIVNEFVLAKGIIIRGLHDAITALLDHSSKGRVTRDDLFAVSDHLQEAFGDVRLLRLPADVLFELISGADPETYDHQALLDFVMKLLERRPSVAIPLIVSLNFCLVVPAQRSAIFKLKSLHRKSLNLQIASALSTVRNRIRFEQKSDFALLSTQLNVLRMKVSNETDQQADSVKKSIDSEIEKVNHQIERNRTTILNLTKWIQRESAEFEKEQEAQAAEIKALHDELESLSALASESREQLDDQQSLVRLTISEEMAILSQVSDRLVPEDDSALYAERGEQIAAQKKTIHGLFKFVDGLVQKKLSLENDAKALKGRLFVKIVRDKLNSGEYIRQTDARYGILSDEPSIWDLTHAEAIQAEERLLKFEEDLHTNCPIRNLERSPPSSPISRGSRSSRSRTAPTSPTKE
jgi:hypothetical protein